MGSVAFENIEMEQVVFWASSDEMIKIVKERYQDKKAEFLVCDIQKRELKLLPFCVIIVLTMQKWREGWKYIFIRQVCGCALLAQTLHYAQEAAQK